MLLGHVDLTSTNTLTQIYQVANDTNGSFTIRVTNRTSGNVQVSLAISDTATPDNSYWILFEQTIYPNDTYTEPAVVLGANQYVFAQTDTVGVNVVVWGFQE